MIHMHTLDSWRGKVHLKLAWDHSRLDHWVENVTVNNTHWKYARLGITTEWNCCFPKKAELKFPNMQIRDVDQVFEPSTFKCSFVQIYLWVYTHDRLMCQHLTEYLIPWDKLVLLSKHHTHTPLRSGENSTQTTLCTEYRPNQTTMFWL